MSRDLLDDDGHGRRPRRQALPVQEPARPVHRADSAAATSASRAIPASCACAAATTRSTTAARGNPPSRAAGRASRMTRTLFDDALQRGLRVPTSCRSHRPLPRVRRRGARRPGAPLAADAGRALPAGAVPPRLPGGRGRSGGRGLVLGPAPAAPDRRRRRRMRIPARSIPSSRLVDGVVHYGDDAGRAAARRRLRRRRRPRHDDRRARARRPARRPHGSRSSRSRIRSASAAAT